MLIEFKISNFRTFYNEVNLSMIKSLKRDLEDTIIKVKKPKYALLPTTVIFGGNATGKTNLILAIEMLKEIVLTKGISISPNYNGVKKMLSLCFFIHDLKKYSSPMNFSISFINDGEEYTYDLKLKNKNSEIGSPIVVEYERLSISNEVLFTRKSNLIKLGTSKNILKYYDKKLIKDITLFKKYEDMLKINISETSVFTDWYSTINKELTETIYNWFNIKIKTFNNLDNITYNVDIDKEKSDLIDSKGSVDFSNNIINLLLKNADFGPQNIYFTVVKNLSDNSSKTEITSNYKIDEKNVLKASANMMESVGTIKLLKFIGPFISAIKNGMVLIVDELDSSIHPEIVAGIIKVFTNPDINKYGAQLIFTTHNPIYLNKSIFRRDEILFVDKNKTNFESELYSLDDLARSDAQYLKNYISGKYVILPYIDFESIMYDILDRTEELGLIRDEKEKNY